MSDMRNDPAVKKVNEIPDCAGGAPEPFILCDEQDVDVIYRIATADYDKFSDSCEAVFGDDGELYVSLTFKSCLQHKFGYPNEEAIEGHPKFAAGLRIYSCFKLEASDWLTELEIQNRVHPLHQKDLFSKYRHFIFPFHDTTFECLAQAYEVKVYKGWHHQVMLERLKCFPGWLREELGTKPD